MTNSHTPPPALPVGEAVGEEIGWLIECKHSDFGDPSYLTLQLIEGFEHLRPWDLTMNVDRATRFARKIDAENFAENFLKDTFPKYEVHDHMWVGHRAPPAAPGSAGETDGDWQRMYYLALQDNEALRSDLSRVTAERDAARFTLKCGESWNNATPDEKVKAAEEAAAEVLRLAEADEARMRNVLERCRTVLGNMALENEGSIFNRWSINHEPLRADAKALLPEIDAALTEQSLPGGTRQ